MCCRSEWQERMYIYKWHEVDQIKHEIFCVHIVCNEIQVKVNLEITTFFFYLRFPYRPNFFWFGVVETLPSLRMLILLMLILVVLFAFVQQINNNLYVLDILCLNNLYFAGVPWIILLSRIPHTHKSLPARTHTRPSRVVPRRTLLRWSAGLYSKLPLALISAQNCAVEAFWNGFPWPSSCRQTSHHQI